jgi:RNA polymerase sigma factor (sigma-70 family)
MELNFFCTYYKERCSNTHISINRIKKLFCIILMPFTNKPIKSDDPDDDKLLDEYRVSGDIAILGKLFHRYMSLLYGVCLKYLNDDELAKDAVMGIFEELVAKVKQHEIKQFRGWLYVLARNYCLMQLRTGKKLDVINLDDVMENTQFLHHDERYNEDYMKILERCMEKLPLKQKQSVELFYLQEKCYKDVADETGFSMNDVKSYIQNGKRNLKICIEKNSA